MTDKEFMEFMQSLNEEHEPDGYPCVKTKDINRLLDIIASLQKENDVLKDRIQVCQKVMGIYQDRAKGVLIVGENAY